MDAATVERQFAQLSAGDAEIAQRLAELDQKLAHWIEAMMAGEAAVRDGTSETTARKAVETSHKPVKVQPPKPVPEPSDAGTQDQDDEALLNSLDEETANAVRVKLRLGTDRRSVREVLAEVRAARARTEEEKQARRRWWRRGDGQ